MATTNEHPPLTPEEAAARAAKWNGRTGGKLLEERIATAPMSGGDACVDYMAFRKIGRYLRLSVTRVYEDTGQVVQNRRTVVDLRDWPAFVALVLAADAALTQEKLASLADAAKAAAESTPSPDGDLAEERKAAIEVLGDVVPNVPDGDGREYRTQVVRRGGAVLVRLLLHVAGQKRQSPPRNFAPSTARAVGRRLVEAAAAAEGEGEVESGGASGKAPPFDSDQAEGAVGQ